MKHILPPSLPPRGLSRVEAAQYIGVSPSLFDQMVADGRMPQPKQINARRVWDRKKLDEAFEALPDVNGEGTNPWDVVLHEDQTQILGGGRGPARQRPLLRPRTGTAENPLEGKPWIS